MKGFFKQVILYVLALTLLFSTLLLAGCAAIGKTIDEAIAGGSSAASASAVSSVSSAVPSTPQPPSAPAVKSVPPAASAPSAAEGLEIGDLAPDFELELRGGGTVRLSDLRGMPVFLNISTTWCGPCQAEFPEVQEALEKYEGQAHILVISSGELITDVDSYFDQQPYTFPIAYDPDNAMSDVYEVQFIPQSYFIDANGIIADYIPGGSDLATFSAILDGLV